MKRLAFVFRLALAVAIAQLAWTWIQRHDSDMRIRRLIAGRSIPPPAPPPAPGLKIEQFYARNGEITDAESTVVCYGVRNARSVRLDPPVARVTPSLIRCFSVEPKQDTTYTLTAEDGSGATDTASFQIHVKPAPPVFRMLAVSDKSIPRGEVVTVCYGVERATAVRMEPGAWHLPGGMKNCIRFYPKQTLDYTLIASGAGGQEQRERFRIAVK
jgi:hypothetical protein